MRTICLLFVALLVPFAAAQDLNSTFHCVVKGAHSVDMKGKLVRNNTASSNLKGKAFTVDRHSGKINADFYTNNSPTVLWNGTASAAVATAYLAEDVVVGRQGAIFSVFQVLRNKTKNTKPFVWHMQSLTITGMCK